MSSRVFARFIGRAAVVGAAALVAAPLVSYGGRATTAAASDTSAGPRFTYFLGAAFGEYDALNTALSGSRYPALRDRPAYAVGFELQNSLARRWWLSLGARGARMRSGRAADDAYSRLTSTGVYFLAVWRAADAPRVGLDVFAGPEVQFAALTLRAPDTAAVAPTTFGAYVTAPPTKLTVFQQTYAVTAGAQLELKGKVRTRPDGSTREGLGLGLRGQVSLPFARSRWRGTDDSEFRRDDARLGRTPAINPLQVVVSLVFTNVFGTSTRRAGAAGQ